MMGKKGDVYFRFDDGKIALFPRGTEVYGSALRKSYLTSNLTSGRIPRGWLSPLEGHGDVCRGHVFFVTLPTDTDFVIDGVKYTKGSDLYLFRETFKVASGEVASDAAIKIVNKIDGIDKVVNVVVVPKGSWVQYRLINDEYSIFSYSINPQSEDSVQVFFERDGSLLRKSR